MTEFDTAVAQGKKLAATIKSNEMKLGELLLEGAVEPRPLPFAGQHQQRLPEPRDLLGRFPQRPVDRLPGAAHATPGRVARCPRLTSA